jgi:hypothetical protein
VIDDSGTMSLAAKVIVTIVGCLVLSVVGVIGLGAYLWSRHGQDVIDAGSRQYDQGLEFGRQTDESGCLDAALTRYKTNRGMTGSLAAGVFVGACWQSSRPTPGFCDGVPEPLDVFSAARWQAEQSKKAGIDEHFGGQIFAQWRNHCASKPR